MKRSILKTAGRIIQEVAVGAARQTEQKNIYLHDLQTKLNGHFKKKRPSHNKRKFHILKIHYQKHIVKKPILLDIKLLEKIKRFSERI